MSQIFYSGPGFYFMMCFKKENSRLIVIPSTLVRSRLAKPVDAVLRPKGMGLGADRNLAKQKANEQETRDPEVDKLTHKKGVHCVVTNGRHKDLYGIVSKRVRVLLQC